MTDRDIFAALLRRDFSFFLPFAFHVLGGEGGYVHGWHLEAIFHQLDMLAQGNTRRLIIAMPPRHLKSMTASIAWVAWMLGNNPSLRFITVSYGAELAEKQGRDTLKILDDPMVRRAFPRLRLTRRSAMDFETDRGGGRLSTSLGGTLTGRGADYIIIDDPTKSKDAASEAVRESDKAWLLNTLMTRLNNPSEGRIALVMQRLHEGDLVGVLREKGGWTELSLPAIAQRDEQIAIGGGRFYARRTGHALHPQRQPLKVLYQLKHEMGSINFNAQFLQDPVPAGGNLIKAEWFRTYGPDIDRSGSGEIIQSWDTGIKTGEGNAWSVCVTGILRHKHLYLIDVWRGRVEFPALRDKARELAALHRAHTVLIEDKASGQELIQTLRGDPGFPSIIPRTPTSDKFSRVAGACSLIEAGQMLLPEEAPWLATLKSELLSFPGGNFNDQVDAVSQLLDWARSRMNQVPPSNAGPISMECDDDGMIRWSDDEDRTDSRGPIDDGLDPWGAY